MRFFLIALSTLVTTILSQYAFAIGADSSYAQTAVDQKISSTSPISILSSTVTVTQPGYVYLQSDGRAFPNGNAIANLYITSNGTKVSNGSVIDWSISTNSQQHAFNTIGSVYISTAGTYTFNLVASSINGAPFYVGAGSNLAVVTRPATNVQTATLGSDSATLSFNTAGIKKGTPLPNQSLVSIAIPQSVANTPVIALASGRIYDGATYGDPLTSIYVNNGESANNVASWSDNDMWKGAENQAPFFNHAYLMSPASGTTVSWNASALPYCEDIAGTCPISPNNVSYKVGGDSTLAVLSGGMSVVGAYATTGDSNNRTNYINIGDGTAAPVSLLTTTINIPSNHNGIVFFTGKTRVQGDPADAGGTVSLWLQIDGVQYGNTAIQQLKSPDSVSTRTIGVNYLSLGHRLSPGAHTVVLMGQAVGSFKHLSLTQDLPLIWFD
ncbi:hypothetical protein [Aquirhabdus sp.]|uniref:hypothetical protein n=1 Tax=Aquirhabdus sp. TaxID=2824160 RepID=UPI00396C6CA0